MKQVVILGGGISGLSAARLLTEALSARSHGPPPFAVTLLEGSTRFGGNLITERHGEFLVDGGPDSWVVTKPAATELARALDLGADLMGTRPDRRGVYIAWKNRLHRMPEGLVLGIPTQIRPLLTTGLFSLRGKVRAALEPLIPARRWDSAGLEANDDEAVADFLTRRVGREISQRVASPLLGGIFAGEADRISVRAAFPQLVEAEVRHGSLVRALRHRGKGQGAPPPKEGEASKAGVAGSMFLSLRGGVGELVDALVRRVDGPVRLRRGARAQRVERLPAGDPRGRFAVTLEGGEVLIADHLLVSIPAHGASALLADLDGKVSEELGAIPYASSATAFLAYRTEDVTHPLDATGFLVPATSRRPILASTWVSSKWAGRAPEGHVLLRVFFGGTTGEETLGLDDDALTALARRELASLMTPGFSAEVAPLFSKVFRFHKASPQPLVGHLGRVARVNQRLAEVAPGLHIAAGGFGGIGIPDCVRNGEAAARVILESVQNSAGSV